MDARTTRTVLLAAAVLLTGCSAPSGAPASRGPAAAPPSGTPSTLAPNPGATASDGRQFASREVMHLQNPWAMAFLPDGRALVTEKQGQLLVVDPKSGASTPVAGTPEVDDAGQGGMHDIVLGPSFETDHTVYLSWVEPAEGESRGVVGKATLNLDGEPKLDGLHTIWDQLPASGSGQHALRLAISPDGDNLFVTSGERQKMTPAQDLTSNLGKIVRLTLDGDHVEDNPFVDQQGRGSEVWSYGHRNPLGIAFDAAGNLWSTEMGPKGGDELNLIEPGLNYGWPKASEGSHYDGRAIPHHSGQLQAPAVFWNPSISPANLMIYSGSAFPQWKGDAFIGGLSGEVLIRVDLRGKTARKADEWPMGERVREVAQSPDGSIYLLTDGPSGRMVQLTPPR